MKLINAPSDEYIDYSHSLFIGGGISNCEDWQTPLINSLCDLDNLYLINPRRPGTIDRKDRKISIEQITWEVTRLKSTTYAMFWFPKESLCPITLLELGKTLSKQRITGYPRTFIGCHPEYDRVLDVEIQTFLESPMIKIHSSLNDLAADFRKEWAANF